MITEQARTKKFPIFIGYDSREVIAYEVLKYTIEYYASIPIEIIPLRQSELVEVGLYKRDRNLLESTEFSFTRFLVPFLCAYRGQALFLDCDMLCRVDIKQLIGLLEPSKAVMVCKHDYVPKANVKFLGQPQTSYPRKNWSSVMLFNNANCKALTPDYVNRATGLALHRFRWLKDDDIGSLPLEWNWLVGEYDANAAAKLLHFTLGGPWFPEYETCDHAAEWVDAKHHCLTALVTDGAD